MSPIGPIQNVTAENSIELRLQKIEGRVWEIAVLIDSHASRIFRRGGFFIRDYPLKEIRTLIRDINILSLEWRNKEFGPYQWINRINKFPQTILWALQRNILRELLE